VGGIAQPRQKPPFPPIPPRAPLPELNSAKEYVERGEARLAAGRAQGIPTNDFEAAIKLDPKCVRAYIGRGECHLQNQNVDEAMRDFDKALTLAPTDPRAWTCRGNAFWKQQQYEKAFRDYDRAIRLDPGFVDAYAGRGALYLIFDQRRCPAKGLADLRWACELTECKSWEHLFRLATAYAREDDYAEAAKWQRAVEKDFERRREELPGYMLFKADVYERRAKDKQQDK
jgi:tetratricopeptide (TPR) repeat protein